MSSLYFYGIFFALLLLLLILDDFMIEEHNYHKNLDFTLINNYTINEFNPIELISLVNVSSSFASIISLSEKNKIKDIKLIDICNTKSIELSLEKYHLESVNDYKCKNIKVFKFKDLDNNIFEIFSTYFLGNTCFLISLKFNNFFDYNENSEKSLNILPLFFNWMIRNKVKENIYNIFTNRERVILSYIVNGKTNWEMSKILNISESSIKFHLKNIFKKTNSNNRTH